MADQAEASKEPVAQPFHIVECGVCGGKARLHFSDNTVAWFQAFSAKHKFCERWIRAYDRKGSIRVKPGHEFDNPFGDG